ncbi:MAG: polyamine aminopropyltransferase [Proteobacteria bacterium]|nr:polyamine aminopropyltransferase [Pseudomonadota bacterium]
MTAALLVSVFVIATCGLVYELLAGTVASYLLGDSVTQFSTVIGAYMFSMGVGSYISRYITRDLVARFVQVETMVGLMGGFSTTLLFIAFGQGWGFQLLLYVVVGIIGVLVGLEIPLLLRILEKRFEFSHLVSEVLSLDYLGALVASIMFPLVLVPKLGLIRSALLFGLLNVAVALWGTYVFASDLPRARLLRAQCIGALLMLVAAFAFSSQIVSFTEQGLYADDVIMARSSPYQRIVLTRRHSDVRLFLSGHLQFSSQDEYRYHEALVHPGLSAVAAPHRVLVLGGGDGMAIREVLKDDRVASVTHVDLDPEMTRLFSTNSMLTALNGRSLLSPKVHVTNADAFVWLGQHASERFDFIIVDFPDPSNFSVGKLYTTAFYHRLKNVLAPGGRVVVQSTSPLFARRSYWCIAETMRQAGLAITPYHVYVPAFGEWGFVLGGDAPTPVASRFPSGLRFLTPETTRAMFEFASDMKPLPVEVNRLDNQILVHYYDQDWHQVVQ